MIDTSPHPSKIRSLMFLSQSQPALTTQTEANPTPALPTPTTAFTIGPRPKQVKGFDCAVMGRVSFKECLAHAVATRNRPSCGHRYETLAAIASQYTRPDPELEKLKATTPLPLSYFFRVTSLTDPCARHVALEKIAPREYVTVDSQFFTTRGTWKHKAVKEFAPPGSIPVGRLSTTVEVVCDSPVGTILVPIVVTGEPDNLVLWGITTGGDVRSRPNLKSK